MAPNTSRYGIYLANPASSSPYAAGDAIATRGAAWSLLRYLADRTASSDGTVWSRLIDSPVVGFANLQGVFGSDLGCVHERIKVTMRPCLVTNKRVHRPSPIDLVDDRTRFKPVNDGVNLACGHALSGRFGVSHCSMVPVRYALLTNAHRKPLIATTGRPTRGS